MNNAHISLRQLLRDPAFTAVTVLTLALGIGVNLGLFSLLNEQLLHPRPVQRPDELWAIRPSDASGQPKFLNLSRPYYEAIRENHAAFENVIGYDRLHPRLRGADGWEEVQAELVSGDYFEFLGVPTFLGRGFLPEEDSQTATHRVAVISHRFWQEHFQGDPAVLGKTLPFERGVVEIVGVAPPQFAGMHSSPTAVWMPASLEKVMTGFAMYDLLGRLKKGVTPRQAAASLAPVVQEVTQRLAPQRRPDGETSDYANNNSTFTQVALLRAGYGSLEPQWADLRRADIVKTTALTAMGTLLVLVIAVANLGNLLLARALRRRKELATRLALGATPWALVRQFLLEGLMLAALGTAGALIALTWLGDGLSACMPSVVYGRNRSIPFDLDYHVAAAGVLCVLLVGVAFSALPALQASRFNLSDALKDPEGGAGQRGRGWSLKQLLVVTQVAGSLVLLSGAFLCQHAISLKLREEPGFKADGLLATQLDLGLAGYDTRTAPVLVEELHRRLTQIPGVTAVGVLDRMPSSGPGPSVVARNLDGYDGQEVNYGQIAIGAGTLGVLGVPIRQGRDVTEADILQKRPVALVNESFVKKFWADQVVLGKQIFWRRRAHEVIGVVQDARLEAVTEAPRPTVFISRDAMSDLDPAFVIRARSETQPLLNAIRSEMRALHTRLGRNPVVPVREVMKRPLWAQRNALRLLGWLGALALALTMLGTYGMMSYLVAQRRREMGIRMAIGARRGDVAKLIVRFGLRLVGAGVVLGLGLTWVSAKALAGAVAGLPSFDLAAFGGGALAVVVAILLACWLPARRAARVDPMEALRHE